MQNTTPFSIAEGQLVYAIPGGNAARYNNNPIEMTVSKIARKYFYCTCGTARTFRFDMETFKYAPTPTDDENSNYFLFESWKTLQEYLRHKKIRENLLLAFRSYSWDLKISPESLEAIYEIMLKENLTTPIE